MRSPISMLLVLVFALAFNGAKPAHAANAGCKAGKASVTVKVRKGKVPINSSRSMEDMWRMSGFARSRNLLLNGLYQRRINIDRRLAVTPGCGGRATVRLDINLEARIYLRRDMGRNSCFYKVSHKHELEHLAIDYNGLRRHGKRLEATLRKDLARMGQIPSRGALEQLVNTRLAQAMTAFDNEALPRQDAIDTREHARRIYSRCTPGGIARLPANRMTRPEPWIPRTER